MQRAIVDLSQAHPRYGYRRITALLQRKGHEVNVKRVQRVRRMEGLQVKKSSESCGASVFPQRSGNAPVNHVWSWDFEEDQTENGTRFRILSLIDEHTRECLALHVAWSIRAVDVIAVVEKAVGRYGVPEHLRSDNGPEFIAYAIQDWLAGKKVKMIYIAPGSPWENAYIENFHDKLRDECLNCEIFGSLKEAQVVIEQWRLEYNAERPHSTLGYKTPEEFGDAASNVCPSGRAAPSLRGKHSNQEYFLLAFCE